MTTNVICDCEEYYYADIIKDEKQIILPVFCKIL